MHPVPRTPDINSWLADHSCVWVVPLCDPAVEAVGFDARGTYTEAYWLGTLGPSALLALRRIADGLARHPGGFSVQLSELARELGLGNSTSRHSQVVRAVARLVGFRLAVVTGDALAVRCTVPALARRHLVRLPHHLAERHRAEIESLAPPRPRAAAPLRR